jgi:hypothetical protein
VSGSTDNLRPTGERAVGVRRLKAAIAQRKLAQDHQMAAKGTGNEIEAAASVRATDEQVSARQRWLEWVGDRDQE